MPLAISAANCDLYGTKTSYYIIVVFRILRYISEFITTVTWFHTPIDIFPYARSIGPTTWVTNNHHVVQYPTSIFLYDWSSGFVSIAYRNVAGFSSEYSISGSVMRL